MDVWIKCGLILLSTLAALADKPNVVFLLADDLGFNDIGYNNDVIKSPNVDRLATEGVKLNSSYGLPACSPSRHALMTSRYPYRDGMQHMVIQSTQKVCSPLDLTILPRKMKDLGYATHMVGKWHLGFCNEDCLPTKRGFDSFYGILEGGGGYYSKSSNGQYDLYENENVVRDNSTYVSYLFAEQTKKIIENHDTSVPLFLYHAFSLPRLPVEVPKQYEDMYPDVKNELRRKYLGMVSMMDEIVGNITQQLKTKGIYDNSVIIWQSDNGAEPENAGNNYPLRGQKETLWEGGTRLPGLVSGKLIKNPGRTFEGMFHMVDWFPTILSAIGEKDITPSDIDGIDQWEAISAEGDALRQEMVYNMDVSGTYDPLGGYGAIRVGDFKIMVGYPGYSDSLVFPPEVCQNMPPNSTHCQDPEDGISYSKEYVDAWQRSYEEQIKNGIAGKVRLFNVKDDPSEIHDLAEKMPDKLSEMKARFDEIAADAARPMFGDYVDPKILRIWRGTVNSGWCSLDDLKKMREESLSHKGPSDGTSAASCSRAAVLLVLLYSFIYLTM